MFVRSADGTKLEETSGMWEGSDAIQRSLDSLQEKANRNLIKFRTVRCKSLDQGGGAPCNMCRLCLD